MKLLISLFLLYSTIGHTAQCLQFSQFQNIVRNWGSANYKRNVRSRRDVFNIVSNGNPRAKIGNIALTTGNVRKANGELLNIDLVAVNGIDNFGGVRYMDENIARKFDYDITDPKTGASAMKRIHDAEAKILEDLASSLGSSNQRLSGSITMYTTSPPCFSCANVIRQFEEEYGIQINVLSNEAVYNHIDDYIKQEHHKELFCHVH